MLNKSHPLSRYEGNSGKNKINTTFYNTRFGSGQILHFLRWPLLKIISGLLNSPGYVFSLKKSKNDIEIA